jgi:phenylacetate-CoA oxygenase PaaI subunit
VSELDAETRGALAELLLAMADDEFVLGFWDSEWTGIAPILEEDVAMSSLAQDELGHAQALYQLLAQLRDDGRDADAIAYDRTPDEYRHARLLDHGRGDWSMTIARRYLYDTADGARLEALATSSFGPLRELVAKIRREERYHVMHATTWLERLADRDGEQRERLLAALDELGPDAATVFTPIAGEDRLVESGAMAAPMAEIEARWRASITPTFVAHGLPIGLGSYVQWDRRLDAALAAAVMSINIVKGVEFGLGFEQTRRFGSKVHDVIEGRGEGGRWLHRTNNAGGLTGGVTNGEPLVVRGAVKPISTLARPLPSADLLTGEAVDQAHYERSDISVVPAAGVVGEAMVMLVLADFMLDKFGGDSIAETTDNLERYRARIAAPPSNATAAGASVEVESGSGGDD